MMDVWNMQLAEHGVKIMKKRQNFIHKLQKWAQHIHAGITAGAEELTILYRPSFETDDTEEESVLFEQFMIKLSQVKDQEIRRGMTLVGPHRDDMAFFINGKEASSIRFSGTAANDCAIVEASGDRTYSRGNW